MENNKGRQRHENTSYMRINSQKYCSTTIYTRLLKARIITCKNYASRYLGSGVSAETAKWVLRTCAHVFSCNKDVAKQRAERCLASMKPYASIVFVVTSAISSFPGVARSISKSLILFLVIEHVLRNITVCSYGHVWRNCVLVGDASGT